VTRAEACENLFGPLRDEVEVEARGFTERSLSEYLESQKADLVLDATHPFAVRITRLAHAVSTGLGLPFVRYERLDWQPPEGTILVNTYAEAAEVLPSHGSRVMLTIGAKQLKHFAHLHGQVTLYARVLPSPTSLEQAFAAGFRRERVMCLRPPFSRQLNRALFREFKVEVLVTKASGREGGVVEKVLAARDLGTKVLMIRRPVTPDIASVSTVEAAVQACLDNIARDG
jgi:precorrin-6A/cobalt-precorrin-6A reductase